MGEGLSRAEDRRSAVLHRRSVGQTERPVREAAHSGEAQLAPQPRNLMQRREQNQKPERQQRQSAADIPAQGARFRRAAHLSAPEGAGLGRDLRIGLES